MNHLFRELAPVSDTAWGEIERQSRSALRNFLAARHVVDFTEPAGWDASAISLGEVELLPEGPNPGVEAGLRRVLPYVELRARFAVRRAELEGIDRGSTSPDLHRVVDAARSLAQAEDRLVFHGFDPAGIEGIVDGSPNEPISLSENFGQYPTSVAMAVASLRDAGVEGPYAAALGPRCYAGILETTQDGGYPVLERLRVILGGPVLYAPAVNGAVVLSTRGGDFELSCGQDIAIGYEGADAVEVRLYLEESLTFRANSAEAAVWLRYPTEH